LIIVFIVFDIYSIAWRRKISRNGFLSWTMKTSKLEKRLWMNYIILVISIQN